MQITTQVLFTNYSEGVTMTICTQMQTQSFFKFINTLKPENFFNSIVNLNNVETQKLILFKYEIVFFLLQNNER